MNDEVNNAHYNNRQIKSEQSRQFRHKNDTMMQIIVFALLMCSLFGISFQLRRNHNVVSYLRTGLTDFMRYPCICVPKEMIILNIGKLL